MQYNLHNQLSGAAALRNGCPESYAVTLQSALYTNTFGVNPSDTKRLDEEKAGYARAIREILLSRGCTASYVAMDGALDIRIKHMAYVSALPQEWLTGLSLGLIPSWGTRPPEYEYTFENHVSGFSRTYTVDVTTYNHLILFPLLWVNLLLPMEKDRFKTALVNFLEHS
ncbi:MAG: hypothetical protein LBE21_07020 [Pseudomonadales bacterium]|jgi:hypothetical protein|nr:hypothetical protein [Pseudomonadales bacterium]